VARRRRKAVTLALVSDITPERRARAGDHLTWPADKRSPVQVARVIDHLERLHERAHLSDRQWGAGMKFRAHHRAAGMHGHMGSIDLHRVLAMPVDKGREHQFHVEQYRKALACLGMLRLVAVEMVVCYDTPLEVVALAQGRSTGGRGCEAVRQQLAAALEDLARLWGL
jgi:hypothetical protein